MDDQDTKVETYTEILLEDYISFAESCGVTVALDPKDLKEILEQFDPDDLEHFMDSDFARGFLIGSLIETTPAMEGDDFNAKKTTTH